MNTPKQEALEIIQRLPGDSTLEFVLYEIALVQTLNERLAEAERGETIPQAEVERRMAKWQKSAGR